MISNIVLYLIKKTNVQNSS